MHTAPEMNGRDRRPAAANGGKAAAKGDNRVMETDPRKAALPVRGSANAAATTRGVTNRIQSRRERKLALQQDVDKLKKKLRHEENVHRALERAFTRPLGALPRLPPYLPSQTLALLAEVAVLEEEVVRLEEQVVNFRQGLYQEATITSSAKNACLACGEGPVPSHQPTPSIPMPNWEVSPSVRQGSSDNYPPARPSLNNGVAGGKQTPRKPVPSSPGQAQDDRSGAGKENQSCSNTSSSLTTQSKPKSGAPAPDKRRATPAQTTNATPDRKRPAEPAGNNSDKVTSQDDSSVANKLSEELLRCLLTIFSRLGSSAADCQTDEEQHAPSPSVSGSNSSGSSEDAYPQDPYGVLELGARGMGPYKRFHVVDVASFDRNALAGDTLLSRRLKALLRRLSSVDLPGLSHQQKRAFWINIYDVCVMNAFLEQGIPTTPHTLVAMMPKAARLPYSVKQVDPEATKGDDVTARWGWSGLSPWSPSPCPAGAGPSPAVRVYTAARVEEELEVLL